MCGLAGAFVPRGAAPPAADIAAMLAAIRHRGPDGEGRYDGAGRRYRAGFARLAVIDLVTGDQPLKDASGRFVLMGNGEIYNYRELRALPACRNNPFRTASDMEPILPLAAAEGEELGVVLRGYGTLEMKSDQEVEAERAAAQSLLSRFVERAGRPAEGEEFYVKAPFPVHGPGGETQEHMWVALRNVGGGVIAGALASASFYEPERWPEGTAVEVLLAEVEALAVVSGGEVVPEDELDGYLS
jgi:hypothetical protein